MSDMKELVNEVWVRVIEMDKSKRRAVWPRER